ncbi:MAG TPA: hypothetical protein VIP46_14720 [Pyrinomonadaceae bacterium]
MSRKGNGDGHGGGYGEGSRFGRGDGLHTTETPDVSHITNPDVMHEESDVSVRGVGTFVGALAAGMIVISVLMIGMYKAFEWQVNREEAREQRSPMARNEEERLPPEPRLQAARGFRSLDDPKLNFELQHPQAEWEALRSKWEFELKNPGQPDPNTGTRRIPIEDAKNMILGQLTARQQPPGAQAQSGIDIPSHSSAGRQPEKRDR